MTLRSRLKRVEVRSTHTKVEHDKYADFFAGLETIERLGYEGLCKLPPDELVRLHKITLHGPPPPPRPPPTEEEKRELEAIRQLPFEEVLQKMHELLGLQEDGAPPEAPEVPAWQLSISERMARRLVYRGRLELPTK